MADEIITRKEARAQGLKRYFTGKPWKILRSLRPPLVDGRQLIQSGCWRRGVVGVVVTLTRWPLKHSVDARGL
jgi:hypothetical protein